MARTSFTPPTRAAALEGFAQGLSVADVARTAGVNEKTLKGWLTRGRREDAGPYTDFAQAVEDARVAAQTREGPMSEDEHRLVVSKAARRGNVQAMKLYWEILRVSRDSDEAEAPADPLGALDELAERRTARA